MDGGLRRTAAALSIALAGLGVLAAGGCATVGEPDPAGWDEKAETALTGAASEVATARLTLEAAADERTWSTYAVVVLADAEEAAGTVEEDLARLQPPPERRTLAEQVLDLLGAATTAVREARQAAVDGKYDDPALTDKLDRLSGALERAAQQT